MPQPTAKSRLLDAPTVARCWLDILMALAAGLGLPALLGEYGFRQIEPDLLQWLHTVEWAVAGVFVLGWLLRLALAPRASEYVAATWGEAAMPAAALVVAAIGWGRNIAGVGPTYLLCVQAYVALCALRQCGGAARWLLRRSPRPVTALGFFLVLAFAGAGLLMLPTATPEMTSSRGKVFFFADALFTATSALTCTGLAVRDTGLQFTAFGQVVLLALMQVGALAIMLLGTLAARYVSQSLGGGTPRLLLPPAGSQPGDDVMRLAKYIVLTTLAVETAGALLLYPMFSQLPAPDMGPMSVAGAVWQSVFHSVSAFCNSGFSLYDHNLAAGVGDGRWTESLRAPLRSYWQVMGVLAPLIVLGGLGMPVLADCYDFARSWWRRLKTAREAATSRMQPPPQPKPELTLHSRIVIWTTVMLILFGALGLIAVEPLPGGPAPSQSRVARGAGRLSGADWEKMPMRLRVKQALFVSVSSRTAGFSTIDLSELSDAGKVWVCGLMLIGGSPGGSAGGMSTVTAFLVVAAAWSFFRRRDPVIAMGSQVPGGLLRLALGWAMGFLTLVFVVTLVVSMQQRPGFALVDVLFESCSACSCSGLSTGITEGLTDASKYVLSAGMIFGKVGMIAVLLAMACSKKASDRAE